MRLATTGSVESTFRRLSGVSDETAGLLGYVVWFALPSLRVTEAQLSAAAAKRGVPEAPTLGCVADAFRRATTPRARKGEGRMVRMLVRPVCDSGEELIRHLVVERVDVADESLSHGAVVAFKFNRETDRMSIERLPAFSGLSPSEQIEVATIERELEADFQDFTTNLTGQELGRWVMRRLETLQHVSVHPRGSVYFVPVSRGEEVRAVKDLVGDLDQYAIGDKPGFADKSLFAVVPLIDSPEQRGLIREGVTADVQGEIAAVMGSIAELLSRPSKPDDKTVQIKLTQVAAVREKVETYRGVLADQLEVLSSAVELANDQAKALLARADQASDKFLDAAREAGVWVEKAGSNGVYLRKGVREMRVTCSDRGWQLNGAGRVEPGLKERPEFRQKP